MRFIKAEKIIRQVEACMFFARVGSGENNPPVS